MSETVTVTPTAGNDSDGDPVAQGDDLTLTAKEIAPGNMLIKYGRGGDLTDVEFTVYFDLRVRTSAGWAGIETLISDGDEITVRGRRCIALVEIWRSGKGSNRGGAAVLARSRSGKAA